MMASVFVDGVRMDWFRTCSTCGRKPVVRTGYEGFSGDGPFLLVCDHGEPRREEYVPGEPLRFVMSRSWSKTRAVANWNRMNRSEA